MEWHEKKFGWLWKNVGGHFPCLFHDLMAAFGTKNVHNAVGLKFEKREKLIW